MCRGFVGLRTDALSRKLLVLSGCFVNRTAAHINSQIWLLSSSEFIARLRCGRESTVTSRLASANSEVLASGGHGFQPCGVPSCFLFFGTR